MPDRPAEAGAPVTSKIQLNGFGMSYDEWPGDKGPLICLSSLTGHKGGFSNIAARLAPEYRVYALDLRGRGDSDKPPTGYGFAYHARDILAFAEALGIDSFALIGHSFGATVGVYLASIRPDRVRAAVLLDGGADPTETMLEAMYPAVRQLGRVYRSLEAYLAAMRATPYYRPWSVALERYFRQDVEILPEGAVRCKASAQAIEHDLDVHFLYSMCLHFPAMRCPTLFIRPEQGLLGDRGHIFSESEATAIVAWIPSCRRVDLPDVNHFTMVLHDDPPVVPPIRAFLAEVLSEGDNRGGAHSGGPLPGIGPVQPGRARRLAAGRGPGLGRKTGPAAKLRPRPDEAGYEPGAGR